MIRINNLCKNFESFKVLDNVNMHVEKGSIYGLVGPNGAGKTTLLKTLTDVYRRDEGDVFYNGKVFAGEPEVKERMIFIPDEVFYFMQANIDDMKKFYKGMYACFDTERFERLSEAFPEIDRKKPIRKMSKGMKKQVAFWLAISCKPEVLILDEPVDGLDPVMRRQMWSIILSDVTEHQTTVIISSHNLRELEDVCDHVGIMSHGKIVLEKSLSELQGNVTKLQAVFTGERPELEQEFKILHEQCTGKIYTFIIEGSPEVVEHKITNFLPLFYEALPLTLEEIFIYEMGGEDYAVKEILL